MLYIIERCYTVLKNIILYRKLLYRVSQKNWNMYQKIMDLLKLEFSYYSPQLDKLDTSVPL